LIESGSDAAASVETLTRLAMHFLPADRGLIGAASHLQHSAAADRLHGISNCSEADERRMVDLIPQAGRVDTTVRSIFLLGEVYERTGSTGTRASAQPQALYLFIGQRLPEEH